MWKIIRNLSPNTQLICSTERNELHHDKTNKMICAPSETQISLCIRPVWSVFPVRMKKALVHIYPLSAQWRLVRLGRCPGWSESSLGAEVILLVLSWGGSNDGFSAERVMKEQEHHQIKPPGAADGDLHEKEGLGHQKLGQDMIGLVGWSVYMWLSCKNGARGEAKYREISVFWKNKFWKDPLEGIKVTQDLNKPDSFKPSHEIMVHFILH